MSLGRRSFLAMAIGSFIGIGSKPGAWQADRNRSAYAQAVGVGPGTYLRARQNGELLEEPRTGARLRDRILPGQRVEVLAAPIEADGATWLFVRKGSIDAYVRYTQEAFQILDITATPTATASPTPTPTLPRTIGGYWVRPKNQPYISVYHDRSTTSSAVSGLMYADEYGQVISDDGTQSTRLMIRTSDLEGFVNRQDVVVLAPAAITATATFTPNPNATATPTRTPIPTSTPTSTPKPTNTTAPTKTPAPSKTPSPTPRPTNTRTPKAPPTSTPTKAPKATSTRPLGR